VKKPSSYRRINTNTYSAGSIPNKFAKMSTVHINEIRWLRGRESVRGVRVAEREREQGG